MNYSHTTIVGRMGRDPEFKEVGGGLWKFSVAVGRSFKKGEEWIEETDWYNCDCWGDYGARMCNGLKKGMLVLVGGEMQSREHEGKTYWSLRPNKVKRLEKREDAAPSAPAPDDNLPF